MTQKEEKVFFIIKMMTPFISQESSWRVFKRVSIFGRDQAENWPKFSGKNRANIGLTRKTEPDDSQPDPDRPDDFEPDPLF